jgi:hypothetical protein
MTPGFVEAIGANLLSPAALFFLLGVLAAVLRSDLRFPEPMYIALTIYLLCAIGFKGGVAMAEAGLGAVWLPALAAVALGTLIPLGSYPVLRVAGRMSIADAAAIAGHYGSVSAVTFTAALNFLELIGQQYESYSAAFLAVMEAPAIIVAILIARVAVRRSGTATASEPMGHAVREALFGRSVLLLVGTLAVGYLCGERGMEMTAGFFVTPFQGILALFLLELGTVAGRRLGDLRKVGLFLLCFGVGMPIVHGAAGMLLGYWSGLGLGGATLLAVLAASASYIAAPAAMRLSLPEANPTLYLTSSLAITFPFNITLGIPLYYSMGRWLFGAP